MSDYSLTEARGLPSRWLPFMLTAGLALIGVGVGISIGLTPWVTVAGLGAFAFGAGVMAVTRSLAFWQKLTLLGIGGLIILNYGFANLALVPGIPLSLVHAALFVALLLAVRGRSQEVGAFLKEPAVRWWLCLVGLSVLHFVFDLPRYGLLAVRDASFIFEGIFMLFGFVWVGRTSHLRSLAISLTVIFLVSTLYALTYPIADTLKAASPVSGLFRPVALLGFYAHTSLVLVVGALFYVLGAPSLTAWPRTVLFGLAALQMCWSVVLQDRSTYLCAAFALILLVLLKGVRGAKIAGAFVGSLAIFFLLVGISGTIIQGRIGDVNPEFMLQHVQSLLGDPTAPAEGSVEWRRELYPQLWARFTASPSVVVFGEGFGEPLIEFNNSENVEVRQPHNTHMSVLVRLGSLGAIAWLGMSAAILLALMRFLRQAPEAHGQRGLALWFFLFFVMGMLFTSFQPWLEFSYGAVPFYVLIGLALRMARDQVQRVAGEMQAVPS